ncbi:Response regulator ArlR [Jeotgalicoccus aerolatus]|uniref:Response regulator ArlR n=1 Tax=Jeotgalicoccus aerolatus TaxID=709510 RepID=A0A1G8V2U5_9STAP|nr:response regulator transcription factor [Jeotgalicoccus aerolatus]MBP1951834.1 two-component system response regulator ArlR [Jeotgalicoccus aerolatus]NMA81981.1 response regulator transcription factor [Jeotgalicoccus aerolatus]CAD2075014.1 Response regulator ArlR [Jeotgalicoccus aerolatus]SDJ60184.1 two-component system, OmpR family, response regulator ArlR [Jeotgalicoccus aerolatus]GGD94416.1 response regulator ArlR [Jeotgalicoccus aerolatus]
MPEVLVVEDETNLARFIELELGHEGYSVTLAEDGQEGFNLASENDYDVILLDLMLPKLNGLEVCRRLRKTKDTPIIIITAKGDTYDKVVGLDYGADDYIVKPFEIEELLARLRVIMRRNKSAETSHDTLDLHGISIDTSAYTVAIDDTPIELTKTEHELLHLLVKNMGIVMKREQILDIIWGYDSEVETNVVDVYIRYLRNKLKPFGKDKLIETVRGVGYVIRQ